MEGENQVRELLRKNIGIKVISVLIAVFFWIFVINTENPSKTRSLSIPLNLENIETLEQKGLFLRNNYKTNMDIEVRGREEVLNNIKDSDFYAVIDFSNIDSAEDKTVSIDGPHFDVKGVYLVGEIQDYINIELEKISENTFSVEVILEGQLKDGYKIIGTIKKPETIKLRDVESLINTADSIKAVVDINDLNRDITVKEDCKVYNKNGEEIVVLGKGLNVEVTIKVAKEVPITFISSGEPADDYFEKERDINPKIALITGAPEVLDKIKKLEIQPVDINNIKQSINEKRKIVLPEGVSLFDTPEEANVTINIEKLAEKEFTFTKDNVEIVNTVGDGSLIYEIIRSDSSSDSKVILKGKQDQLQNISISSLKPSINVEGLDEGIHKLDVYIVLPYSIEMEKGAVVEVKIEAVEQQ